MAFDTKTLKRDGSGITPVPQHFNPVADDYEPQFGRNNAGRVELYGPDGDPISSTNGKLAVRATEIETLLDEIRSKDFATQTTLLAILNKIITAPATEAGQQAAWDMAESIYNHLTAQDFATEGTLAQILAKIIAAPATEAKQDALIAKDFATQATLAAILTQLGTTGIKKIIDPLPAGTNVIGKVSIDAVSNKISLDSSIESVTASPVVGSKTVTATAAEVFAGSSVKTSRRKLIIRNEDQALRVRVGPSNVTQQNGYPVEPGGTLEIQFDPATDVAIYGISEGAALNVAVMEV